VDGGDQYCREVEDYNPGFSLGGSGGGGGDGGGGDFGGGSEPGTGGGEAVFSLPDSSSPEDPIQVDEEVTCSDNGEIPEGRAGRALTTSLISMPWVCSSNITAGQYFEIPFSGAGSGIYRHVPDAQCGASQFMTEIEPPPGC